MLLTKSSYLHGLLAFEQSLSFEDSKYKPCCLQNQKRSTNNKMDLAKLTLSPLDGPFGPNKNTVKKNFSGSKVQNIVNVLMAPNLFGYVPP